MLGEIILFFLLSFALAYFLPSIVAIARKKKNAVAIFMLNLFLGWSFVGWVVALVWALMRDDVNQEIKAPLS